MVTTVGVALERELLGAPSDAHSLRAKASLAVGRHAEALEAVRRARRKRAGSAAGALVLAELEALFGLQRDAEALGVASRALRRPAERDLEARLRVARGYALWRLGRLRQGLAEVSRGLELATAQLSRARAHETLGLIAWKDQDLASAAQHLETASALYRQADSRDGLARTLGKRGALLRDAGCLKEALRMQTLCVELAATTTRLDALARARGERGQLLIGLGRWAEAREELSAAADLFGRVSDPREFTLVGVSRATLELAAGDPVAARAALQQASGCAQRESRDPRSLAEIHLALSDVSLAEGEAAAAEAALAEALVLFAMVRDRVGECRARSRRAHVLLALGRPAEAAREAQRARRLASWPTRADLRAFAELALGRSLLRSRPAEAQSAFERVLALSPATRPLTSLARLGRALGRGAARGAPELEAALAEIEAWGDRRMLAYCLAEVEGRELSCRRPAIAAPSVPRSAGLCTTARVVAAAALALSREDSWTSRWAAAMRALQPLLGWQRAAFIGRRGAWQLRSDREQPLPLPPGDLAWLLTPQRGPALVDFAVEPALRGHPQRVLNGLRWALVAPDGEDSVLYAELRDEAPRPGERELEALVEVARIAARNGPEDCGPATGPAARYPEIVGRCAALETLFSQMERVSASQMAVHVFGETGTGKERVARALHARSPRGSGPFVAVNASTLPDELFEAEMFGHTRGAFTGAVAERLGHVAHAEGGTLFIDEIADLTPRAQAKLLRFLQDKEYRRLGETLTRRADVRVITASNVRLEERVAKGVFREDLLYRLNVVELKLPPLRERGDDVLLLARHFLREAAARESRPAPSLPADVAGALARYPWPGNVRELENEVSRLLALSAAGPLRAEQLSEKITGRPGAATGSLRQAVLGFEREHVARVLAQHGGNRARAAVALCLTRQALVLKIRRLGIA